jgi:hypothetical protein
MDREFALEWLRREYDGYMDECEGQLDAAEYMIFDLAADIHEETGVEPDSGEVSKIVWQFIRGEVE